MLARGQAVAGGAARPLLATGRSTAEGGPVRSLNPKNYPDESNGMGAGGCGAAGAGRTGPGAGGATGRCSGPGSTNTSWIARRGASSARGFASVGVASVGVVTPLSPRQSRNASPAENASAAMRPIDATRTARRRRPDDSTLPRGSELLSPERYRVAPTDAAPRVAGRVICQSGCRARDAQLTFTLSAPSPPPPGLPPHAASAGTGGASAGPGRARCRWPPVTIERLREGPRCPPALRGRHRPLGGEAVRRARVLGLAGGISSSCGDAQCEDGHADDGPQQQEKQDEDGHDGLCQRQ
jgi:hypothetical protein